MKTTLTLLLLLISSAAFARQPRSREVKVTVSLREQVAVRAWLEGVQASTNEERRDLVSLYDDLGLAAARRWVDAIPPDKAKTMTVDKVPEDPRTAITLDRGEATTLIKWLAPTDKRTQDVVLGRILLGFSDAVEDAMSTHQTK